jgi:formate dehydrogenase major subunit
VHQVWMPYHWGHTGLVSGDVVNDLFGVVADANVFIQESKVATCDIRPGPRPRGAALLEMLERDRARAGVTIETGTVIATADGVPHIPHIAAEPDSAPDSAPDSGGSS